MKCLRIKCETLILFPKMPSRTLISAVTVKFLVLTFVIIQLLTPGVYGAPQQTSKDGTDGTNQNVQTILSSIEERLRNLDGVWSRAKTSLDSHIHHTTRKLEHLDSRLQRLETIITDKFDLLNTRLQEEEHMAYTRSIPALQARVAAEHARNAAEHARIESLNAAYACTTMKEHIDVQAAMADSAARAERWKSPGVKLTKNTRSTSIIADTPTAAQVEARLRKLEEASTGRKSLMQQDSSSAEEVRAVLAREASNISAKMSNMYNELWRRSQSLETMVKDSMTIVNATRRESQDGLRSVMLQLSRRGVQIQNQQQSQDRPNDYINRVTGLVQKKMSEMNNKMDKEFEQILMAQNRSHESCHRIQLDESRFEAEIIAILEKLIDSLTNKTITTFDELKLIQNFIKSHDSHIIKAVARAENAALMCSKNNKVVSQNIDKLREAYKETSQQGLNKEVIAILEEKVDGVMTVLQELQEQFTYTESQENEVGSTNENFSILDNIGMEVRKAVTSLSSENGSLFCSGETQFKNAEMTEKLIDLMQKLQDSIENLEDKRILEKYHMNENENDEYLHSENENIQDPITANELIEKLKRINYEDSSETKGRVSSLNEFQNEEKNLNTTSIVEKNTNNRKHHIRHGRWSTRKQLKSNQKKPIPTKTTEAEEKDDYEDYEDYESDNLGQ